MAAIDPQHPTAPADPDETADGAPAGDDKESVILVRWDKSTDSVSIEGSLPLTIVCGVLGRAHHQANAAAMATAHQNVQRKPKIARPY